MAVSEGNSSIADKIDVGAVHIAGKLVLYANSFSRCAPTDRPLIISLMDEHTLNASFCCVHTSICNGY